MASSPSVTLVASSSSVTPFSKKKYDVFLSYSDERSPYSFTSHLNDVLLENKISTFIDDSRLQRGDEISPALLNAIEESRISLIIFSKDYAGSRLCLDELVKILECREKYNQIVIPVYYDIEPSQVRKQTGPFAEAFKNHEAHKSMQKWRVALAEAANTRGYNLPDFKSEAALTQVIVDEILKKLDQEAIHEPKPSSSNIGEPDGSHIDEEADDYEYDHLDQNRGVGGGGGDGGDGGGDGGDGGGGGGGGGGVGGGGGGGEEAIHDLKRFQWITAERIFVTTNLILEVPSVVFDKLSSVHKPQYALVSMLMSFTTMLICIIQLAYQGGEARVGWKREGKILWLYWITRVERQELVPSDKPFGTVTDFIGLLCAIFQSIFTAIDYALYLRNINDPIQISIWPLVFSFCIMCSTFSKKSQNIDASTGSAVRRVNNV